MHRQQQDTLLEQREIEGGAAGELIDELHEQNVHLKRHVGQLEAKVERLEADLELQHMQLHQTTSATATISATTPTATKWAATAHAADADVGVERGGIKWTNRASGPAGGRAGDCRQKDCRAESVARTILLADLRAESADGRPASAHCDVGAFTLISSRAQCTSEDLSAIGFVPRAAARALYVSYTLSIQAKVLLSD